MKICVFLVVHSLWHNYRNGSHGQFLSRERTRKFFLLFFIPTPLNVITIAYNFKGMNFKYGWEGVRKIYLCKTLVSIPKKKKLQFKNKIFILHSFWGPLKLSALVILTGHTGGRYVTVHNYVLLYPFQAKILKR